MKERFFIEGKTDGSFTLWDSDSTAGAPDGFFSTADLMIESNVCLLNVEKNSLKKVDIDAVL